MSFRKYEEYKESGVEWLGEIPEHWQPLRLKWVVHSVLTGGTPEKEAFEEGYIDWFTPGDFKDEVVLKSAQKQIAPEKATKGLQLFPPNSVLIVGIGATLGKVGLLKTKSAANQQINGVIPNSRVAPTYLAFSLFAQNAFMKQIANISTLSIMNQDKTKQIPLAVPPIDEQKQIAAFLDKETTKIDTLIDKQEQLIKLLQEKRQATISHAVTRGLNPNVKMKDSGIEWLGEIPTHWLCVSLKNIEPYNSQMVQTGPFGAQLHASDYVDEGVPLILIKNVRNLAIDDSDIPKISAEDATRLSNYRVEVGDIVFSRVGSIGRIAKITEKERGWLISGQMLRLRLGSNLLNSEYSLYALSSKIVEDYVAYYSVGSTRDSINTEILMNLKIPLPPVKEQKQIAAFLDKETTKIDILIEKCETAIELLKERRTALISAAVTGKIDVRNVG